MKIREVWFAMLVAVVLMFPTVSGRAQVTIKSKGGAAASQKPAGENGKKPAAASTANCAVTSKWQPDKLEGNTEVLGQAANLAGLMAYNYAAQSKDKKDDELTAADLSIGGYNRLLDSVLIGARLGGKEKIKEESVAKCTAATVTADTNKQVGAPSGADGSTSTTELTGIPELLSIAVENGSVTNSISGNTMTLSTTLYGLLTGFGLVQDSSHNYDHCGFCVALGASGTFNVANTSSPLNSATRKAASQWQLKYSFFDRSTRSKAANDLWDGTSTKNKTSSPEAAAAHFATAARPDVKTAISVKYSAVQAALNAYVQGNIADVIQCIKLINASSTGASGNSTCVFKSSAAGKQPATQEGLANLILQGLDSDATFQKALNDMLSDSGTSLFVDKYQTALSAYNNVITQFEADVANLSKGWNADVTFGEQFPTTTASSSASTATGGASRAIGRDATTTTSTAHLPDYLVGGLDLSWQPKTTTTGGGAASADGAPTPMTAMAPSAWTPSWTFNGKGSFYTNPNASLNEKTFRGAQASTQFQWTLGASPFVSNPSDKSKVTVALNGSYQRLPENKDQKGKRPDTTSGSFKLTIPFANGISIPLAVTYGNSQQQQAKGAYVIGNFGMSFDADKLASLLALKH